MSSSAQNQLPELETSPQPAPQTLQALTLASLLLAVLALFLFAWIAESVSLNKTVAFDSSIRARVHHFASPRLTRVMIAISFLGGDGLVMAAVTALLVFLFFGWRRATLWLLVTLLGALVLDLTLKFGFHRARPAPFFGSLPRTYSFPSGHSLFAFCFYGVLAGLWTGRIKSYWGRIIIWAVAALLVTAIGLSRIYLGVHYPSDVVAGYLTATLWVSTLVALDRLRVRRNSRQELDRRGK